MQSTVLDAVTVSGPLVGEVGEDLIVGILVANLFGGFGRQAMQLAIAADAVGVAQLMVFIAEDLLECVFKTV